MTSKHFLNGDSVEILLSREQAAEILNVSRQMLYHYLKSGSLFLDTLKRFRTEDGEISKAEKLTNFDIPVLKRIQFSFRKHGERNARVLMSQNPDYFYLEN
ncbi:hypothetical protein FACHB389_10710 [Nostoc calcicola FACHB-389]|nr:DNA-binding protein [Nostoc calcicola FACHB-3891]OKH36976.1 hypothetical protein FACHB389_10710 [Nostoc calcicola FACHB-389]